MCPLEYCRPETLEEAIAMLDRGVPLAGGTALTPQRRELTAVIDLQAIGLDNLKLESGRLTLEAAVTLQALVECGDAPDVLRECARLEAGWNIRNAATLAGLLHTADGRSPLLTALSACTARVLLQPGDRSMALDEYLRFRSDDAPAHLVTALEVERPLKMQYEYAGRSPADRPMVCAAAARYGKGAERVQLAVGGFGPHPLAFAAKHEDQARTEAEACFRDAADDWASADYRSAAGSALAVRVFREVTS